MGDERMKKLKERVRTPNERSGEIKLPSNTSSPDQASIDHGQTHSSFHSARHHPPRNPYKSVPAPPESKQRKNATLPSPGDLRTSPINPVVDPDERMKRLEERNEGRASALNKLLEEIGVAPNTFSPDQASIDERMEPFAERRRRYLERVRAHNGRLEEPSNTSSPDQASIDHGQTHASSRSARHHPPAPRYPWESDPAPPESKQRKNTTVPPPPSADNAGPTTQHRPTPTSSLPRSRLSLTDIKELSNSVWESFDAGPSRIPIPVSSRRSSTSSHGPISRQSSIPSSAPMSRRTSNSSFTSSPLDGRIGPRSPNAGFRYLDFHSTNNRNYDLRQGREAFSSEVSAWSLEELQASIELEDIAVQTVSREDIQHDLDNYLSSLLAILRNKDACMPMGAVANVATVGIVRELLDMEDTTSVVAKLGSLPDSDVQTFLDFIIYLLDKDFLLEKGANEIKRKARRLALKLLKRKPTMPHSLLLPEITMKTGNQEVGRGGFAFVLKGEMQGRPVALKVLHRVRNNDDFCREAFIWRTFSHEHVLTLLGIHENPLGRFLVSPYMENGTLSEWRKKKTHSSAEVQQRILEAAKGIRYIHSENMVHGDVRGNNVLLDGNFRVKIADFGLARHNDATATQSWALSYNFAAPELFGDYDSDDISSGSDRDVQLMKRTLKTDVYAFACLYYEIHFDSIPFKNNSHPQIIKMATSGQRPPLLPKPELNAVAWKLIRRCWRREPARRPSMEDVVDNMMSWQSPSKK